MPKTGAAGKQGAEIRNIQMVKNIVKGMPSSEAYAKSRGRDKTKKTDSSQASRALSRPEVQALIDQMKSQYIAMAPEALQKEWELADKETTPPHVKQKIWQSIQERAMPAQPQLNLHKHEHKYPELVKTKEQIIEILDEPETANEISKRNRL